MALYFSGCRGKKLFPGREKAVYITAIAQSVYKKIETEVGVELFDRTASPLILTEAGAAFVGTANKIQELESQLMQQVTDLADLKCGKLTIGSSDYNSTKFLPRIIYQKRRAPSLSC